MNSESQENMEKRRRWRKEEDGEKKKKVQTLFVVNASQMIILPSWEEETICRLSKEDQSRQRTLPT